MEHVEKANERNKRIPLLNIDIIALVAPYD